ncbi:MAG: tRNA pseudouridine(55) synthase TruB [Chloroflexi bacterium RBG_16_68_14]|nr:MAG: tRNA pseudouridine(55) synthase TruB [Chloroflexi bacterium RBG_16_68_14]
MASGILNINKPPGMASFAVVSLVRRLTGVRRVGHAGTLDPTADGVLPICLGRATRVVEYLVNAPKTYYAAIRLGSATDTYDSEGTVTATGDPSSVTQEEMEAALAGFVGQIEQIPPMYSALKYEGQPLYRYARAGKTAPRQARTVTIHRLELRRFAPPLVEVELEVGRGAYVRTLAHDLGERLGCHAHLERLTRLRSGPFSLADALGLDELREAAEHGTWRELLYPVDRVLESWYAALLGQQHTRDACRGRLLVLTPVRQELVDLPLDTPCRAYSEEGEFLAILRYRGADRWQPERVFATL